METFKQSDALSSSSPSTACHFSPDFALQLIFYYYCSFLSLMLQRVMMQFRNGTVSNLVKNFYGSTYFS